MAKDDKLKPFIQHLSEWLKDLNTLLEKRNVTLQPDSITIKSKIGDVTILTSDKEKIELLRKNQKKLFKNVKSLENKLVKEKGKLKKHIDSLEELIKNLNINSLGYEWVSLYWLAIGLILRTYPQELAILF